MIWQLIKVIIVSSLLFLWGFSWQNLVLINLSLNLMFFCVSRFKDAYSNKEIIYSYLVLDSVIPFIGTVMFALSFRFSEQRELEVQRKEDLEETENPCRRADVLPCLESRLSSEWGKRKFYKDLANSSSKESTKILNILKRREGYAIKCSTHSVLVEAEDEFWRRYEQLHVCKTEEERIEREQLISNALKMGFWKGQLREHFLNQLPNRV